MKLINHKVWCSKNQQWCLTITFLLNHNCYRFKNVFSNVSTSTSKLELFSLYTCITHKHTHTYKHLHTITHIRTITHNVHADVSSPPPPSARMRYCRGVDRGIPLQWNPPRRSGGQEEVLKAPGPGSQTPHPSISQPITPTNTTTTTTTTIIAIVHHNTDAHKSGFRFYFLFLLHSLLPRSNQTEPTSAALANHFTEAFLSFIIPASSKSRLI